jgi:hypothetical protein
VQRRRRLWVTRAAAAVGVVVACAAPALPAYSAEEPIRIWTDATGPLFASTNLEPGSSRTQCLALSYEGRDGTSLRMAASTSGGLDGYLDLTVAVGTGGSYGDCSGFVGSQIYAGTLAEFSDRYGDPSAGLALDNGSAPAGAVSIRVTLRMQDDNRAQGQAAESSFIWYAMGNGADPTQPPDVEVPVTGPVPTTTPAAPTTPTTPTTPPSTPSPRPASPTPQPASPTGSSSPEPSLAPGTAGPPAATGGGRSRSWVERVVDSVVDTVKDAAPAVIGGARLPLYLLPVVLLFLLIQNEIDRRDPKLALAPAYADPDLPFDYDPTLAKA